MKGIQDTKGLEMPIRAVALIALGLMVVVILYLTFETVFDQLVSDFLEGLDFAPQD